MKIACTCALLGLLGWLEQLRSEPAWPIAALEIAVLYLLFFGLLRATLRWTQE